MRAKQSKWAKELFKHEGNSRKLLKQLTENDRLDGRPIKTDFGYFNKK